MFIMLSLPKGKKKLICMTSNWLKFIHKYNYKIYDTYLIITIKSKFLVRFAVNPLVILCIVTDPNV